MTPVPHPARRGEAPYRVQLVLTREGKRWRFMFRHAPSRTLIPAYEADRPLRITFATRERAARYAEARDMPAYGVWNGQRRTYEGLAYETMTPATPNYADCA